MWIITENLLYCCQKNNEYTLYKSDDCPIDLNAPLDLDAIRTRMPHKFRLLDDDGNVYYIGYCDSLDDLDEHGHERFMPIDWAEPHSGCVVMQYVRAVETISVQVEVWDTLIG